MGLVNKLKNMFTEYDEEYEDELDTSGEIEDFDNIRKETEPKTSSYSSPYSSSSSYGETSTATSRSKVVNIQAATQLQVMLVKPERFEDAKEIAIKLNQKITVVLNLESTSKEVSRRLLDFLSGVAFANGGEVRPVANCTFIITPSNVSLIGDLLNELENSGVSF